MSIEDSSVIDFVAVEPSGEVLLVMVEGRDWDGSDERLYQLQEKINSYAAYVRDGEIREKYPQVSGRPVRLELRCASLPDPKTAAFLEVVRTRLQDERLAFSVKQIGARPSG